MSFRIEGADLENTERLEGRREVASASRVPDDDSGIAVASD